AGLRARPVVPLRRHQQVLGPGERQLAVAVHHTTGPADMGEVQVGVRDGVDVPRLETSPSQVLQQPPTDKWTESRELGFVLSEARVHQNVATRGLNEEA